MDRWLTDVSPFAHAFAAMISSEFTGLETTVEATGFDAVTVDGSDPSLALCKSY